MGRTIIQPIGPLYGEAVNGTVFGRPNGSVYIPESNQIAMSIKPAGLYVKLGGDNIMKLCSSSGSVSSTSYSGDIVARSQDIASYVRVEISDTSDFTGSVSYADLTAGQFNLPNVYRLGIVDYFSITNGTTYYVRAVLMSSTNIPVATSDTIEVTGWDN